MIKAEITGYIVRDFDMSTFSPTPFEDHGHFDLRNKWENVWVGDDPNEVKDIRQLDELLDLSQQVNYNTPYSIRITAELEPVPYKSNREKMRKERINMLASQLSEETGVEKDKILKALK